MIRSPAVVLFASSFAFCACTSDNIGRADGEAWSTTTTQVGDTTVVRTTGVNESDAILQLIPEWAAGSSEGVGDYAFGEIRELAVGPNNHVFVFDQQFVSLREYDSAGVFLRYVGGKGAGPGEFERINGMAVHRDGRLVAWIANNATVGVYSQDMQPAGSWIVPGSATFNTIGAVFVDTAGNTYLRTRVGDPPAADNMAMTGRMFGITGALRYSSDGSVRDSLIPPEIVIDAPRLIASVEGNTTMNDVPYGPRFMWTISPNGAFVSARNDVYALDITSFDGKVTRIEMEGVRVPVTAAEKSDNEAVITAGMRNTDPNWRWNASPIPDMKPYFKGVFVGGDGRIWVSLSRPGEEIPEEERAEPRIINDLEFPVRKWREPVVFDVFESDGRYMGRLPMPPRATWRAAKGEHVWAVVRDSLDLEQIARFRIGR